MLIWLLHSITENAARRNNVKDPKKESAVSFDGLGAATEHIGPAKR